MGPKSPPTCLGLRGLQGLGVCQTRGAYQPCDTGPTNPSLTLLKAGEELGFTCSFDKFDRRWGCAARLLQGPLNSLTTLQTTWKWREAPHNTRPPLASMLMWGGHLSSLFDGCIYRSCLCCFDFIHFFRQTLNPKPQAYLRLKSKPQIPKMSTDKYTKENNIVT